MTSTQKSVILREFLAGQSVSQIAEWHLLTRQTVEGVIREGATQAMQQLAAQPDAPVDVRLCEHCGQHDPEQEHYDAWSDWGGDADEPDGWICEEAAIDANPSKDS